MGSITLPEVENKILQQCQIIWSQRIVNQANNILHVCQTPEQLEVLFFELERNIKDPRNCRLTWNTQIQSFDGETFGYLWFFYSNTLQAPVKICLYIDPLELTVGVGNMELANADEKKKLDKHLNSSVPSVQPVKKQEV
ncbi:hypothetical protein HY490_03840 [Candidatus Woesearchaeota archaeon]|nr:hypothetical protein [Candidatus Woesearchaeota archaeon]